jgi:hypothetical protein
MTVSGSGTTSFVALGLIRAPALVCTKRHFLSFFFGSGYNLGMKNKLILGGHSFIAQLGSDPAPDEKTQDAIVSACLDSGITVFDTTYQPERVALGSALKRLGRRSEAELIAWNFFVSFGPNDPVSGHHAYEKQHLEQMLREFQTDHIEHLVVHPVTDKSEQARQEALAIEWLQSGVVGRLGTWMPGLDSERGPYEFAVAPCNVTTTEDATGRFSIYKTIGWETIATSPFVRGWELEKRIASLGESKSEVADKMLRFSAFFPNVDRLIVSMRHPEWVAANCQSIARGPLSPSELL